MPNISIYSHLLDKRISQICKSLSVDFRVHADFLVKWSGSATQAYSLKNGVHILFPNGTFLEHISQKFLHNYNIITTTR